MTNTAGLGSIHSLPNKGPVQDSSAENANSGAAELAQQLGQLQLANIESRPEDSMYPAGNQNYPQNAGLSGLGQGFQGSYALVCLSFLPWLGTFKLWFSHKASICLMSENFAR